MGQYIVDLLPANDGLNPSDRFVSSQTIPLAEYQDFEPGDILGPVSSPFLRIPLEALTPHDAQDHAASVAESTLTPVPPHPDITAPPSSATLDPPDEPPPELICRLDDNQCRFFLHLSNTVPLHTRWEDLGSTPPVETLVLWTLFALYSQNTWTYFCRLNWVAMRVSISLQNYGPSGTQPMQPRLYRLNPVLSKQADSILDSYITNGLTHPTLD